MNPITDEIATTDKDIDTFAGWLRRLENPDPVLRTEAAGQGLRLYDEVDRDPHAGAVLQTRYLSVARCEWEVLAGQEGERGEAVAEFVRMALEKAGLTRIVADLLNAVLYGFSVAEVMWRPEKGAWLPGAVVGKHPRRFSFTMDRQLRLLTPADMIEGEPVPDRKFVVLTWGSSDNPYGKGLGQKLWWPVWFKKHGIKFWLVFLEKFGMPTAVGKYPPGTPPEQQAALLTAIDAIQNESGIKVPSTMTIELLEAARSGQVTYETLCEYMDRQVSKAVLGQTLTTEVSGQGSYAAGRVHDDVRQDIKKADADLVCEALNRTLVRWIVDYNFTGVTDYPQLWIRTDEEQDLKALAERDRILLVDMGLGRRVPESYITEAYGIPMAEGDEPVVTPVPATVNDADPNEGRGGAFADGGADGGRFTADQRAIEDLIASVLPEAGAARDRVTAALTAAVEQAESFEDLQILLAEMQGDAEADGLLAEIAARAMTAGHMWGRYAAGR